MADYNSNAESAGNADDEIPSQLQQAQDDTRPKRTVKLSQKSWDKYISERDNHQERLEKAWDRTESAMLKVSNARNIQEQIQDALDQLRSSYVINCSQRNIPHF